MTLAIVIKNIILFILIIFIAHFVIKNFLLDKESVAKPIQKHDIVQTKQSSDAPPLLKDATEPTISKKEKEPEGLDKAKADLLKFVDEEDSEQTLNKYFTKTSSIPTDDCKSKVEVSSFPLSTTCDPNIQTLHNKNNAKDNPKKPKQCTLLTKNVMVLNEYDNENTMNGGDLFNGLNAFDSFDNHFQLIN